MGGGILAYHLSILEREDLIISKKEGSKKCFYPGHDISLRKSHDMQMMPSVPAMDNIQDRILTTIRQFPGITQKGLALSVGLSDSGLNYHVNVMASSRTITVVRDGKKTRCYLIDDLET